MGMRCFIALDFDQAIKRELSQLQRRLSGACPGVRWTDPSQIHLTLKFLGEIEDQQVSDVAAALNRLAAETASFDVRVEGVGAFPPGNGPARIVWVGLEDEGGALGRCQGACEMLMGELGFPRENRGFRPHLTLGRVKDARSARGVREALYRHSTFSAGTDTIEHITFYQSTLLPGGPEYTPLGRHGLTGR